MLKCPPNELPVNRIKSGLEINKIDVEGRYIRDYCILLVLESVTGQCMTGFFGNHTGFLCKDPQDHHRDAAEE